MQIICMCSRLGGEVAVKTAKGQAGKHFIISKAKIKIKKILWYTSLKCTRCGECHESFALQLLSDRPINQGSYLLSEMTNYTRTEDRVNLMSFNLILPWVTWPFFIYISPALSLSLQASNRQILPSAEKSPQVERRRKCFFSSNFPPFWSYARYCSVIAPVPAPIL